MNPRALQKWCHLQWRLWQRYQRKRKTLGAQGERWAARHLRRQGFQLIHRQARNLYGEIDIIAADGPTVVFVEVKTRRSADKGEPSEAVTSDKQKRLTRIAQAYLKHHQLLDTPARFDVIAITWPQNAKRPSRVDHIRNAFDAQ